MCPRPIDQDAAVPDVGVLLGELLGRPLDDVAVTQQFKRGRRRLLMATVRPVGEQPIPVVLKLYPHHDAEGDGTWAAEVGWRMEASGFGPGSLFRVAPTLGVRSGALLCELAPGTLWRYAIGTPGGVLASELVGAWLARLQRWDQDLPPGTLRGSESVAQQTSELAVASGAAAAAVRCCGSELAARLIEPLPALPSHGNAHPENFFINLDVEPAVVTAIDLDTLATREAAHDIGYAIGQALIRSRRVPGPEHGYVAALSLLDGYRSEGGVASDERVATQTARALFQAVHHEAVILGKGPAPVTEDMPVIADLLEKGFSALRPLAPRG